MPPLLHDRYLMLDATTACDLATGAAVAIATLGEGRPRQTLSPPALIEMLEHGRDGEPRAVVATVGPASRVELVTESLAADAVARGYVPIAVGMYSRLRLVAEEELGQRTLLLIATESQPQAAAALLDAASLTPRPHVLVTFRTARGLVAPHVREARAAYGASGRPAKPAIVPADVLQHVQRGSRAHEFVAAGRHAAAERLLRDVAAALMRRGAWPQAVAAMISLGRLLLERGRANDAVKTFTQAVAAAGPESLLATEARIWTATARTDAGQLTAAESICRSILVVGGIPPTHVAWTQAVLVRVLLWQNRTGEALSLAPALPPGDVLDASTAVFIRAIAIRLLLCTGRLFEAGVQSTDLITNLGDAAPMARVIALTSHLRVLTAAGDLIAAASCLEQITTGCRAARTPLRLARARLLWIDALRRAGRTREATATLESITRVRLVAPALLRNAIEQRRAQTSGVDTAAQTNRVPAQPFDGWSERRVTELVTLVQEEDDDGRAVERVLMAAARDLRSTRLDLWSADAGPATIIRTVGTGLATTVGGRVVDTGIAIGGDDHCPSELGAPVRLGDRLVGALVARWPVDRRPPEQAGRILELVAAVAAARIDALLYRARSEAAAATLIPELVGVSRAMGSVRQAVARAAAAPFAVLIEGESGVGKELIARAVHCLGPRRERRFCDVNCAALPDDLIESELFGHAKGAFTGAVADRPGLFEDAHGGTLFLDEIADLSARAQAKLLRVLQQHEIRRVGETFARPVDVRVVAAANRDMRAEAAQGRFRTDLLYRIDVVRIDVPALRERPEDIPVLAQHFWRSAAERVGTSASLTPAVLTALSAYHWPGNVRELQNVIAALAVAAPRRGRVGAQLLPAAVCGATPLRASRLDEARAQFERRFVEVALARAGGNRALAARAIGLSRQGLLKLLDRLKMDT